MCYRCYFWGEISSIYLKSRERWGKNALVRNLNIEITEQKFAMKKITLGMLLIIGLFVTTSSNAQIAVGLRAGLPTGISLKLNPMKKGAFEFIVGTYGRGNLNITGLYEFQKQISGIEGLMFYAGPGLHINFQSDVRYYRYYRYNNNRYYDVTYGNGSYISAGADAIFGIEYKIPDFPMSVGADLKPAIDIGRYDAVFFIDGALNIRFYL